MAQALASKTKLTKAAKKPTDRSIKAVQPRPEPVSPIAAKNCRTCHDGLGGGHKCPGACAGPELCPLRYTNPQKWKLCMFDQFSSIIANSF